MKCPSAVSEKSASPSRRSFPSPLPAPKLDLDGRRRRTPPYNRAPADTTVEAKVHEVQKYYTNIPIQYGSEPITMSKATWDKLTAEQQEIVRKTCQEAGTYQREIAQKMGKDAEKTMADYGCEYIEFTPDQIAEIQEKTAFLPDYAFAGNEDNPLGTTVSGVLGSVIVAALAFAIGTVAKRMHKRKSATA